MKLERPAVSPQTIISHYIAVVKAMPPDKRPTFVLDVDFCYVDKFQGHVAIGNLHEVIVRVAKVSSTSTDEVLRTLFAWKGLRPVVTTATAGMQAEVAAARKKSQ